MKRIKLFPVILSCDHEILLPDPPPPVGSPFVCFACHSEIKRRNLQPEDCQQTVVFVRKYTARCRDCTYRNHEGDLTLASERAREHCNRRQHHVSIWYPTIESPIVLVPTLSGVVSSLRKIA